MDNKMTVEITGLDEEKHAEDMIKRAKVCLLYTSY